MEQFNNQKLGINSRTPNGEYICNTCGMHIDFDGTYSNPICPTCGGIVFTANNSETYLT